MLNRREYLACLTGAALIPLQNSDLAILSAAAALELQAVAAYQAGAASGKLSPQVLVVASDFLHEHEAHARGINAAIEALGGSAAQPLKRYHFGPLANEKSILALALDLEQGAADAYAALATNIENRKVLTAAATILVDEVKHVTLIRSVLGLPVL